MFSGQFELLTKSQVTTESSVGVLLKDRKEGKRYDVKTHSKLVGKGRMLGITDYAANKSNFLSTAICESADAEVFQIPISDLAQKIDPNLLKHFEEQ